MGLFIQQVDPLPVNMVFSHCIANGSTFAQVRTSQFADCGRFDRAVDVAIWRFYTKLLNQPSFLTALSIPTVGTGNASGVRTVPTLTLENWAGK